MAAMTRAPAPGRLGEFASGAVSLWPGDTSIADGLVRNGDSKERESCQERQEI
jgi:hypothetical protein